MFGIVANTEFHLHAFKIGQPLARTQKSNSDIAMNTRIDLIDLSSRFVKAFGNTPRIFVGPGRINIIGEHVDYCGGMVMPAAIDRACYVAIAPNGLGVLRVQSDFGAAIIGLDHFVQQSDWRDYVGGMAFALKEAGIEVLGHDMIIQSDVPIGAGVSSSAALEVGVGMALTAGNVSGPRLAVMAQRAENHFAGMNCGIMDQFASANGVADCALLLDCASLDFQALEVPTQACFLLVDSGVKHQHVGGGYESRRADCEEAATSLGVALLSDIETVAQLAGLKGNLLKRARHVVSEIARTKAACAALAKADLTQLGALMNQSHASLSQDMEVSTPKVDILAQIIQSTSGVYGARMMGGGFGGSVIALVDPDHVEAAQDYISAHYAPHLGRSPDSFVAKLAKGAHEWIG
jgi:galactokinase